MDKVVIEDYYYTTTMNENVDWMKLTNLLSCFSLSLGPILYIYVYFRNFNSLFGCTY